MPKNFTEILPEIVEFTRAAAANNNLPVVKEMLHATKNLLLVLDVNKADAYKMALAEEYIEDAGKIMKVKFETDLEINRLLNTLTAYVPVDKLTPELVTFWTQKNCDEDKLKDMQVLMLFLTNEEKAHVFNKDEELRKNELVKLIAEQL